MIEKLNIKKITSFLNNEYKEYSRYTVEERALPSLCDSFKPGARKIMHAAFEGTLKDGKTHKLLALSGESMNISQYAHGDASLNSTIVTLAKGFINNLNPLEIDGQGGSLRDPDAAGSPRYLYIKKSKYMDLIYKTDYDLLEYVFDEGMYLEPMQYYPIIPTVLCSMTMGIANGYSFHTMAYNPLDIIDCCKEVLSSRSDKENKITTTLRPYLRKIKTSNWRYEDGKWYNYGEWKVNMSKDLLTITDLPCDMSYEDFEKLLNKFIDKNYIKSYKNLSKDGDINYEITFPKGQLAIAVKKDKTCKQIANTFKLIKELPDDLLWFLDENHKLKHFVTKNEVIEYFTKWRLSIYRERKSKMVKILEERYKDNSDLVKFIELVCNGKLKIRNRSKADIKIDMDGYKLPMTLISTPMSKCTIEERDELLRQNEEIKRQLDYIKNTTEKQMYLDDLDTLKNTIAKDFPESKKTEPTIIIEGEARKTVEDKELEKALKLKEKEKKEKEKARIQKDKDKKAKERIKAQREKEKEIAAKEKIKKEKLKIKAAIDKNKIAKEKLMKRLERAKVLKDKESIISIKADIEANKAQLVELREKMNNTK